MKTNCQFCDWKVHPETCEALSCYGAWAELNDSAIRRKAIHDLVEAIMGVVERMLTKLQRLR